jgi:hypothetical protein
MRFGRVVLVRSPWWRRAVVWSAGASLILAALVPSHVASAAQGAATQKAIEPALTGTTAHLSAVAVVPRSDRDWAVGWLCSPRADGCDAGQTYVSEFDGSKWSRVKAPSPTGSDDTLTGVSASSVTNAWAVGSYNGSEDENLLLHWNGRAWAQVGAPNLNENSLTAVSTLSAKAAWAVGSYNSTGPNRTLILAWNGARWSRVRSPNPSSGDDELFGVVAVSPSNVWAVGSELDTSTSEEETLVLHWNGKRWTRDKAPPAASLGTRLNGVAATSPRNVWAVGQYHNSSTLADEPLVLHWNGKSWTESILRTPEFGLEELEGVATTSAGNAWAVGIGPCVGGSVSCPSHTLTYHWHGTTWSHIASPSVRSGSDQNILNGVAIKGSTAVAVGDYFPAAGGAVRGLALRWNGRTWARH